MSKFDTHIPKMNSILDAAADRAMTAYMSELGIEHGLPRLYWTYGRSVSHPKRRSITGMSDDGDTDSILAWAKAFGMSRVADCSPWTVKYGRGIQLEGVRTRIEIWTIADKEAYDAYIREVNEQLDKLRQRHT